MQIPTSFAMVSRPLPVYHFPGILTPLSDPFNNDRSTVEELISMSTESFEDTLCDASCGRGRAAAGDLTQEMFQMKTADLRKICTVHGIKTQKLPTQRKKRRL